MNKKSNSERQAGTAADSSTTDEVTTSSPNNAKPNVVGSLVAPQTAYAKAWDRYGKSSDYKRTIEVLNKKGIVQPYADNILRSAFEAGYNMVHQKTALL